MIFLLGERKTWRTIPLNKCGEYNLIASKSPGGNHGLSHVSIDLTSTFSTKDYDRQSHLDPNLDLDHLYEKRDDPPRTPSKPTPSPHRPIAPSPHRRHVALHLLQALREEPRRQGRRVHRAPHGARGQRRQRGVRGREEVHVFVVRWPRGQVPCNFMGDTPNKMSVSYHSHGIPMCDVWWVNGQWDIRASKMMMQPMNM